MRLKFWGPKLYMASAPQGTPTLPFLFPKLAENQAFSCFTFVVSETQTAENQ